MREILVTPQFRKDLRLIPKNIKEQADNFLLLLNKNPTNSQLGVKKLKGFSPAIWRIRIGMYRMVYTFDKHTIKLLRFLHRKDIYRSL